MGENSSWFQSPQYQMLKPYVDSEASKLWARGGIRNPRIIVEVADIPDDLLCEFMLRYDVEVVPISLTKSG
jgi:hypothetical protein